MNRPPVFAVAFTHAELVLRAVREFTVRQDSLVAADVVAMLENAVDARGIAAFSLACEEVAP